MDARDDEDLARARSAKEATVRLARKMPCVNAIGITKVRGRYAVKVSLSEPAETALPEWVEGVPLVVEVVGPVRKQHAKAKARR